MSSSLPTCVPYDGFTRKLPPLPTAAVVTLRGTPAPLYQKSVLRLRCCECPPIASVDVRVGLIEPPRRLLDYAANT